MNVHTRPESPRCDRPARWLAVLFAALVFSLAYGQTGLAQPQPYYFTGVWFASSNNYNPSDPLNLNGNVRSDAQLWNCVGATNGVTGTYVPLSGVFIYDPSTAYETTSLSGNVVHFPPAERDYAFPGPQTDANSLGGVGLPAGYTQMNYLTSGGKTFRTQPGTTPPDGYIAGTDQPTTMKVVNNANVDSIYPGAGFAPPVSYQYWDSLEFHNLLNVDPVNGPAARDFSMVIIDPGFGQNPGPGSMAPTLPGSAIDGSQSTPPASLAIANLPPGPGAGWGGGSNGNSMSISAINKISYGDSNSDGHVNVADFQVLLAHYNQAPGTFQINPGYSDAFTPSDSAWLGTAIWSQGDFNLDGKVDLNDYKVFLNPGLMIPGAPRNFAQGDANFDGVVNGLDIAKIASNWLHSSIDGDTNADGIVNGLDIALVASHWLQSQGSSNAAAVPEPSSLVLAGFAGVALVSCGRRRRARTSRLASAS